MGICKESVVEIPDTFIDRAHSSANKLRKSNVILQLHFGNLHKLLSANVDVT